MTINRGSIYAHQLYKDISEKIMNHEILLSELKELRTLIENSQPIKQHCQLNTKLITRYNKFLKGASK